MEINNEFKEINIKNRTFYYFDDILEIENVNLGNISIDEKLYENISQKTLIGAKPLRIRFDKLDEFIRALIKLDIQYYLEVKNMIPFIIGLRIL